MILEKACGEALEAKSDQSKQPTRVEYKKKMKPIPGYDGNAVLVMTLL